MSLTIPAVQRTEGVHITLRKCCDRPEFLLFEIALGLTQQGLSNGSMTGVIADESNDPSFCPTVTLLSRNRNVREAEPAPLRSKR